MSIDNDHLRRQYEVERELGNRLRYSTRAERPALLRNLYSELHNRAPDHDRLSGCESFEHISARVEAQMKLLRPWLATPPDVFLEFAPGAGYLSAEMCRIAGRVFAADISDQRAPAQIFPTNFQFITYDGYKLDLPNNLVSLAFSYQLIEHIHPEDISAHFALAWRLLQPGGVYVFATPHRFSGPHDISRLFSDTPLGLHLKEWTYNELIPIMESTGFKDWRICRRGRYHSAGPAAKTLMLERFFGQVPGQLRRHLSQRLLAGIVLAGIKPS